MKNYIPWAPLFILKIILWIVENRAFKRPYRIIFPSEIILDYAKKYKLKKPTYLLPTGIDDSIFYPRSIDEKTAFRESMELIFPCLKGKQILLYAGRVGKEKNLELILNAANKIIKERNDVIFMIAGSGPDIYWLKEECEAQKLINYFVFTGYLERATLANIYCISKIFIFPSITETQGLVTIEAMLSGIPIVAVGERGTLMVMRGDNGGFMVPNNADIFANRILDLLRDESLYRKKAMDAINYGKKWTMDIMGKRLESIYTDAISDYKKEKEKKPVDTKFK
jgi:glycosyltransferase involved in cell wall biosynthesis